MKYDAFILSCILITCSACTKNEKQLSTVPTTQDNTTVTRKIVDPVPLSANDQKELEANRSRRQAEHQANIQKLLQQRKQSQ